MGARKAEAEMDFLISQERSSCRINGCTLSKIFAFYNILIGLELESLDLKAIIGHDINWRIFVVFNASIIEISSYFDHNLCESEIKSL